MKASCALPRIFDNRLEGSGWRFAADAVSYGESTGMRVELVARENAGDNGRQSAGGDVERFCREKVGYMDGCDTEIGGWLLG